MIDQGALWRLHGAIGKASDHRGRLEAALGLIACPPGGLRFEHVLRAKEAYDELFAAVEDSRDRVPAADWTIADTERGLLSATIRECREKLDEITKELRP